MPAKRRAGYIDIAVRRWAPFADPDYHVNATPAAAMVWAWSRATLADPAQPGDAPVEGDRGLPESVFLGQPEADGEHIQACVEGFEGRVWRDHVLQASLWWPQEPDLAEWNRFLRGAGQPVVDAVPMARAMPRQAAPWTSRRGRSLDELGRRYRGSAMTVAIAATVLAFAWQLGALLPLAWKHLAIQREMAQLQPVLQPIMTARENAERDLARIQSLLALRPAAGQVALMADLARVLPQRGVNVTQWKYGASEGLEVMVQTQDPDPQPLVQALEESGRFAEASAEPGDGADRVRLRAKVDTVQGPAP